MKLLCCRMSEIKWIKWQNLVVVNLNLNGFLVRAFKKPVKYECKVFSNLVNYPRKIIFFTSVDKLPAY
jgi:hypothetical protein